MWTVVDRSEADPSVSTASHQMSDMEQRRRQLFEVAERAKSLGARTAEHQPQPERVLVMLDPAGHPF